jgi:hypothetical protein
MGISLMLFAGIARREVLQFSGVEWSSSLLDEGGKYGLVKDKYMYLRRFDGLVC